MPYSDNVDSPGRHGTRQVLIYSALFVFFMSLVTLPATLIAVLAWRFGARRWGRAEYSVLLVVGIAAAAINPSDTLALPILWLVGLFHLGSTPAWPLPWLGFLVQALLYEGLFGLAASTLMWTKVTHRMGRLGRMFRNPFHQDSVVPTDLQKSHAKVVTPPGGIVDPVSSVRRLSDEDEGNRKFAIGTDAKGRPVFLTEEEARTHGVIFGSTGSGKTETIKGLAASLLDLGWAGMILDLKEDTTTGGLRDFLVAYTASHTTLFQQLTISDPAPPTWFNPLYGMGPDEARDTILSLTEFDDSYWQNINKKMLGQVVTLVYDAHAADPAQYPYPTVFDVGRILSQPSLEKATRKMRQLVTKRISVEQGRYSALENPSPDEAKSASGFGAKLTQMYNTVAGRTVLRGEPDRPKPMLDVTQSGLTYVGLDTQGKPDLSTMVSSAVLQRLSVYAAQRTTGRSAKAQSRFLIIDEANLVDRQIMKSLLARARSAEIFVILCTQGPEDWIDRRGDDWSTMAQNVNFAIIMAQGSPKSAELCADFIGQGPTVQVTADVERDEIGQKVRLREGIEYLVEPHELRALSIGEAVLRVNKPAERVTWLKVHLRDPEAQPGTTRRVARPMRPPH